MALWLIPILYVAGTLCFGIVFLRFEHEYLVEHKINLSQWFFNDFSIASAQACLGNSVRYDWPDSHCLHRRLHNCPVQLGCLFTARGLILH